MSRSNRVVPAQASNMPDDCHDRECPRSRRPIRLHDFATFDSYAAVLMSGVVSTFLFNTKFVVDKPHSANFPYTIQQMIVFFFPFRGELTIGCGGVI
jgi:hypothetical protein